MITKKKPIKVRRRILSNKRTKGGKKKQHSKKRRTKRTKNKIKGGANSERKKRKLEDEDEAKPEYERWTGEAISFVLVDLHGSYLSRPIFTYEQDKNQSYFTNAANQQRFLSADGNSYKSFELNDLVARDVVGENAVAGSGLRDDIIFWFFSRYTNSTPNINSHYIIQFILIQNWKTIFSGLKLMEQQYQKFYSSDEKQCLISIPAKDEEKIIEAQTFIKTISEPFQIAVKQMIEKYHKRIWKPCSGFGHSNSECSKTDLERTSSQPLHNAAFASCDLVPSGWYNRIQQFVKSCISNFFDKPREYKKSKWHISATGESIKSAYPRQTDVQIIETRKKELYGLSYKGESDRVITIFTKPDAVHYAYTTYHLLPTDDKKDTYDDGIKNKFFTYRVFPEEPDKCIILIREAQFKEIQKNFLLPDRTEYIDSSSGLFDTHSIFFIDDINFILYNLFNLSQDEIINFYESCRGRPDAS
jgi:hypothetical protein